MRYMGSKRRAAKHIVPILNSVRQHGQPYVEPFVGGANLIDKMDGWRIGADSHEYLIAFWRAFARGWEPPADETEFTEDMYHHVKNNRDEDPVLTGYVGFALSYGAKWFGGWSRDKNSTDYVAQGYRSVIKQRPDIVGVQFVHSSYDELPIPSGSLIYCDPPYRDTTKYRDKFDSDAFWLWTQKMALEGHTVFVSEYIGPYFAKCVWANEQYSSLTPEDTGGKKAVERLYVVSPDPEVEAVVMPKGGYIECDVVTLEPANVSVEADKPSAAPKPSSKPSVAPKPPSKPSAAPKPPSKPSVAPKPPSKPSVAPKPPSKPPVVPKPPSVKRPFKIRTPKNTEAS